MNEITPLPYQGSIPFSTATPFTYREGVTMLELIHALKDWAVKVVPDLNGVLESFWEKYLEDHQAILNDLIETKDQWQTLFDQFMADVVAQLEGLNDQAVANLVNNEASLLREALNSHFIQVSPAYELYVNPLTGSDSNPGSPSAPFKTVNHAVDVALERTTLPDVSGTIHLAAGGYSERIEFPDTTPFNYRLHIKGADVGGHPFTPTTVFSEGDNARAVAFVNRNSDAHITFEDIAFNGYKGTSSSGGITNVNGAIRVLNCHFNYCHYGVTSFHGSLEMPNGKLSNCTGAGVRSMMNNRHTIGRQNAGERSRTTIFENNLSGLFVQENSTGHADYCNFINNSRAVECNISSRVNATGSLFDGNIIGIYLAFSSNTYITQSCEFINNNNDTVILSGSTMLGTGRVFDGGSGTSSAKERASFGGSYSTKEISSTSSTEIFRQDIYKQWFKEGFRLNNSPVKEIRTYTVFRLDGTGGRKYINIRHLGGNQQIEFGATEVGVRTLETVVKFVSPTKQIVHSRIVGNFVDSRAYVVVREENMNSAGTTPIMLQGSVESAGDSITVYYTEQDGIY